jgi:hypothetical protein
MTNAENPIYQVNSEMNLPKLTDQKIINLISQGEKITHRERIDWQRIKHEEAIVDKEHVMELARQLKSDRGQLTPILVRAILEKGDIKYEIADGFHRDDAFPYAGITHPDATVMYNCEDEEFYDLRITAALKHESVKFARMGEWILIYYSHSKWAKKGFTISQLASLTMQGTSGVRLGLTPQETEDAKTYILEKANRWGMSPVNFHNNIATVEKSDPDLVRKVRTFSGGSSGNKYLNTTRLKVIADTLPKEFEKQQIVANIVIGNNLNQTDTAIVASAIKLTELGDKNSQRLLAISDPLDVCKQILEDNNQSITGLGLKKGIKKQIKQGLNTKSYKPDNSKEELEVEVLYLKRTILFLQERHKKNDVNGNGNHARWWDELDNLSASERRILEGTLWDGNKSFEDLGYEMNLTQNQISACFISAFAKLRAKRDEEKIVETMPFKQDQKE